MGKKDIFKELSSNLSKIREYNSEISDEPDELTKSELSDYESQKLHYENEKLNEQNVSAKQDRVERKRYASKIFVMVSIWLSLLFIVIIFQGASTINLPFLPAFNFHLSDTVLITLITTTTINVLAYFLKVVTYLFPNSKEKK